MSTQTTEIWKPINGFAGYQISNHGRVRSVDRIGGAGRRYKGRILKPRIHNGYYLINFNTPNGLVTKQVHRLLIETFRGPVEGNEVVNHLDHNRLNNNLENLELTSYAENTQHYFDARKDTGIKVKRTKGRNKGIHLELTPQELITERWVDVVGYEGIYQVSNYGRVKSCPRIDSNGHRRKERQLKLVVDDYGYLVVGLSKKGKPRTVRVHKLVAESFIGDRPTKHVIHHIDSDKTNNRIENLKYVSYKENAVQHQLIK